MASPDFDGPQNVFNATRPNKWKINKDNITTINLALLKVPWKDTYITLELHRWKTWICLIVFDFESSQDKRQNMTRVIPIDNPDCPLYMTDCFCGSCSKCHHCSQSWCGKNNYHVSQMHTNTQCYLLKCGTWCKKCEDNNHVPCLDKCGQSQRETCGKFGRWLFSDWHRYFKVIAHNMKEYDGYFVLEYLLDQSIRQTPGRDLFL